MSKFSLLDRYQWKGTNQVYQLPLMRNRVEFSADPERIKDYTSSREFTRSQLTRDMLSRFHLSNESIVVSDDQHAQCLRKQIYSHFPERSRMPAIARQLLGNIFQFDRQTGPERVLSLSASAIRENYFSLLDNLLGVDLPAELYQKIAAIEFKPGSRPIYVEGLMFSFGLQLPGFKPMRSIVDWLFFRRDHYTRKIARQLEDWLLSEAKPRPGGWYEQIQAMRRDGVLSPAQVRGELTSMLVSSFSLSAALCFSMLCLAARPDYVNKIRLKPDLARGFVCEVLRLYPPFRRFGYEEVGIWKKPARARFGATDFMVSVADLHRDERIWEAAESFHAERFMGQRAASGCKYLPFGLGRRSCIGRVYSMHLLIEAVRFLCSEACPIRLGLPVDYDATASGLPIPLSGRLVSFPRDDRVLIVPQSEGR